MKAFKTAKILTAAALAVATTATVSAAFAKTKTYNGNFTDVGSDKWYAKEVASAYELGFMDGMSDTSFSPDTTVTVAQGITMAARVHAEYNNKTIPEATGEWYEAYVKYAKENGIISENQFDSYTRELKRFEMAEIFHDAMPDGYFNAINDVDYIPDVPVGSMYEDKLLTLYNAGIVMGSDDYGTFNPDSSIVRSECAAIINRVAIPENRVKGELLPIGSRDAYLLTYTTTMEGHKEGINSGWVLDNRGGTAKYTNSGFSTISDVSDKYGTAWIREFNYIPMGEITLETKLNTASNGAYIEYRDVKENTVYMIKLIDGQWNILTKDGKFVPVAANSMTDGGQVGGFTFRISVNLDTGKSTTFVNDEACGSYDLLSDNIFSYRVGIDEKNTGSISMNYVNMVANYAVNENFDLVGIDEVYGWKTTGTVKRESNQLNLSADSTATKTFTQVDGNICTETYFYSKTASDFDIALGDVITVSSKGGKLIAGDKEIYTLTPDMWYRLRFEADTEKGTAKIYLNGQLKDEVKLAKNAPASTISVTAKGAMSIDDLKVYKLYEHEDYVPVPEAKASMDDYIVGLNICSLWRNGDHYGWHCISPFDEPTPVIGYYDEGNPETADWEIKFMVEHGIDFQAFCWYNDSSNGALKQPRNSAQLHEGFQYAKYSDYMKYCILVEAQNCSKYNSEQFRNYVVPYWFENYFLDDRYMTINNKLVLPFFMGQNYAEDYYFGSVANAKAELEWLEEQAKKYGFDGFIFLNAGKSSESIASMGFDGSYSYNWGTAGSSLKVNKDNIIASADIKNMYTVPTISVGFDSIPWHQKRYQLMTVQDYVEGLNWVKNTYQPAFDDKYDWSKKFAWLSTWNEYGEGTYIMPAGLNGFGYLDAVRSVFTELPEDHTDVVPTLQQRERINHLYPQYARLLRREGWYTFNATKETKAAEPTNRLYVNGQDIFAGDAHEIPPMIENGKVYFPYEPVTCLEYIMNVLGTWRKDAGTLLIEANGHSVKMLVGSDRYIKDGKYEDLGYTLKLVDGIPMLDFVKLCEDLEYKYEEKDGNLYIYSDNYETVWADINNRKTGIYEFNSTDPEGWSSTLMTLEVKNGSLVMTTTGTSRDPISRLYENNFPEDFYTNKFTSLEMKIRYKYDTDPGQALSFYYITDIDGNWNELKTLKAALPVNDTGDEWQTVTIDLTTKGDWISADRLTGLRFDPFNALGYMEIDYIRFIEDPDFVYVPAEERPMQITNGDAEGEVIPFYSGNATITRIQDPADENNHVWYVKAKNGKQWTYFRSNAHYKEGATYKIDFDIKLVGNNGDDPSAVSTSYTANLRYADEGALNNFDHLTNQNTVIAISDGWKHCSVEYTTAKVDNNESAEFTIYVNPVGEYGFSYYLDNIRVVEVGSELDDGSAPVINENKEGSIIIPTVPEETPSAPAATVKPGIITVNGDAEGSEIKAFSDNAEITIVTDPEDPTNKVYQVSPKKLGKSWTYFRYPTELVTVGVTYKMSYDIKFMDNNENDGSIDTTSFDANVVYKDVDAHQGMNHVCGRKQVSKGDGWVHCEWTFTPEVISAGADGSEFSVYANPVGDAAIGFYIDNFTVEVLAQE